MDAAVEEGRDVPVSPPRKRKNPDLCPRGRSSSESLLGALSVRTAKTSTPVVTAGPVVGRSVDVVSLKGRRRNTRLSGERVEELLERYRAGDTSVRELAEEFGATSRRCCCTCSEQACRGRTSRRSGTRLSWLEPSDGISPGPYSARSLSSSGSAGRRSLRDCARLVSICLGRRRSSLLSEIALQSEAIERLGLPAAALSWRREHAYHPGPSRRPELASTDRSLDPSTRGLSG